MKQTNHTPESLGKEMTADVEDKFTEKELRVISFLKLERQSVTHNPDMPLKTFHAVCKSLIKKGVVLSDRTEIGFMGYYIVKK